MLKNQNQSLTKEEVEIKETVNNIIEAYYAPGGTKKSITWITEQILENLGKLVPKEYLVASKKHDGEWMYDLAWIKKDNSGFFSSVELILESEISDKSREGLIFDFAKLLIAQAKTRVFICRALGGKGDPVEKVNAMIDLFRQAFKAFTTKPANCRVLVLIWDDNNWRHVEPLILTN